MTRRGVLVPWMLLLATGVARAGDPTPAKPAAADAALEKERAADPLTTLERGALKRATRVVVAKTTVIRESLGSAPMLVRVEVERRLWGAPARDEASTFTMFVGGPPSDTSPSRFYAPYFRPGKPVRHVLFLVPTPAGSGWSLDSTFPVDDPEGDEKVAVLEKELALASVRDPAERRAKTLAHLVALLGADRPWSRLHAARELAAFAPVAPEVFTSAALKEIAARRARTSDTRAAALLASVLARFPDLVTDPGGVGAPPTIGLLAPEGPTAVPPAPPPAPAPAPAAGMEPCPAPVGIAPDPDAPAPAQAPAGASPAAVPFAPPPAPAPAAAPTPPASSVAPQASPEVVALRKRIAEAGDAVARIQALTALSKIAGDAAEPDLSAAVSDPDPAVREQAALLAGDALTLGTWPALQAREAKEDSVAVREAIVRAAGLFRDAHLVPWVAQRGSEKAMRRTAAFALARIRTPEAMTVLARWRDESVAAGEPAPARLVEYLTSDAFVRVERQAKRDVGPR